jgi:hypothetical protein
MAKEVVPSVGDEDSSEDMSLEEIEEMMNMLEAKKRQKMMSV